MYAWEYSFDILPAASGEDSYGLLLFLQDDFGGFLPQPPYVSGGSRGGFTFGLPAHRSCDRKDDITQNCAFYPRSEGRGFTAQLGKPAQTAFRASGFLRGTQDSPRTIGRI